jgi:hypothetical protein
MTEMYADRKPPKRYPLPSKRQGPKCAACKGKGGRYTYTGPHIGPGDMPHPGGPIWRECFKCMATGRLKKGQKNHVE